LTASVNHVPKIGRSGRVHARRQNFANATPALPQEYRSPLCTARRDLQRLA